MREFYAGNLVHELQININELLKLLKILIDQLILTQAIRKILYKLLKKFCNIKNIKLYNINVNRDYGKSKFHLKFQNCALSKKTTQSKNSLDRRKIFRKYYVTLLSNIKFKTKILFN